MTLGGSGQCRSISTVASFCRAPRGPAAQNIVLGPGWRWRKAREHHFLRHAFLPVIEGLASAFTGVLWCQVRGTWRYWLPWQEKRSSSGLSTARSFSRFCRSQVIPRFKWVALPGHARLHRRRDSIFASHAHASDHLAFKHHPRDRGYNNYASLIRLLAKQPAFLAGCITRRPSAATCAPAVG